MALGQIVISLVWLLLSSPPVFAVGGSVAGLALPNSCGDEVFSVMPSAANTKTNTTRIYARTRVVADMQVRYSTFVNGPWTTRPAQTTTANALTVFDLPSLTPDTRYYYRVDCRLPAAGGTTPPWQSLPLQTFKTLGTAGTPKTFTDVVTADPHWVPALKDYFNCRADGTNLTPALSRGDDWNETSRANREPREKAQRSMIQIGNLHPTNYFDLGDFYHTHSSGGSNDCVESNVALGSGPAAVASTVQSRIQFALSEIYPARAQSTFWLVRGNHDNSWGPNVNLSSSASSNATCNHNNADSALSIAQQDAHVPNANIAYPAVAQGADSGGSNYDEKAAFFAFNQAQVTYIAVNEYHYTCETPGSGGATVACDSTTGLPNSHDDWTIGAIQRAWIDNMDAGESDSLALGDVVVVMSHHPFGGTTTDIPNPGRSNCYYYGRAHPYGTVDGNLGSDWLGEEEWLHDKMAAWAASGKTVIRLYGHDHRFGWLSSRDNVHYFVVGQPGLGTSNWLSGVINLHQYKIDFDVDPQDGVLDWEVPSSQFYAPKSTDFDFTGFVKLNYYADNATKVRLEWADSEGSARWVYDIDVGNLSRLSP